MTPAAPAGSSQPSRRVQAGNRGPPTDAAHRQPCETAMVMLLAADFKSALSALIGAIFEWLQNTWQSKSSLGRRSTFRTPNMPPKIYTRTLSARYANHANMSPKVAIGGNMLGITCTRYPLISRHYSLNSHACTVAHINECT